MTRTRLEDDGAAVPVSLLHRQVRIPAALRSPGYVFSGHDRIVGFFGDLRSNGDMVSWDRFLACCTRYGVPHYGTSFDDWLGEQLTTSGWTPSQDGLRGRWRRSPYLFEVRHDAFTREGDLVHLVLSAGDTSHALQRYLDEDVGRHAQRLRLARAVPTLRAPRARRPQGKTTVAAAVGLLLQKRRVFAYTGAGISRASGIPTFFGEGSLDETLQLIEPFPGEIAAWMIADPERLARLLLDFHERLIGAMPNRAHFALASLERVRVVEAILTSNIDMLHEAAGSRRVFAPRELEQVVDHPGPSDALLVLGVSDDNTGVIAACRSASVKIVIVDRHAPTFATSDDTLVTRDAADVLGAMLAAVRRRGFMGKRHAPFAPTFGRYDLPDPASRSLRWLPVRLAVPDFAALVRAVVRASTSKGSTVHGVRHWKQTMWASCRLLAEEPRADPAVALVFGLVHDCLRVLEAADPEHGLRAARLVIELVREHLLDLSDDQLEMVKAACEHHSESLWTSNPTVGICWDADRVGLWRLGLRPEPTGMSLARMRDSHRIAQFRAIGDLTIGWQQLWPLYRDL